MRIAIIVVTLIAVGAIISFVLREKTPALEPIEKPIDSNPQIIGTTIEGRNIESYSYGKGEKNLLFVGGVHGGYEWNTVTLAYNFIDYLEDNPEVVPGNLTVAVIPSANPDGFYRVVKKEGRFSTSDVSKDKQILASGRFNAHEVDLNRNFDCEWQPKSTWQSKTVSAGTAPFSEPEAKALKNYILEIKPEAVIFWHSKSGFVYASHCDGQTLPETTTLVNTYSRASGYPASKTFDSYDVTGDAEGWLAKIGIPAITVELTTHETIEWEKNLAGVKALFEYYGDKR